MVSVEGSPSSAVAQRLASDAKAIATGGFETASVSAIKATVVPRVLQLVDEAIEFADHLVAQSNKITVRPPGELPTDVEDVLAGGPGADTWQDVAFICSLDLRGRRERVVHVSASASDEDKPGADGAPELLVACDSATRRVLKGVGAIDLALAAFEHRPPVVDFTTELAASLRVRKLYSRFRRKVATQDAQAPGKPMLADVRALGIQIAVLAGADEYPDIRLSDRMMIRGLQRRVLAWLREPHDVDAGRRLLQDARAFADMLPQVNQRQELVEHDARAVRAAEDALSRVGASEEVTPEVWGLVAPLEGLSDSLDLLLALRSATAATLLLALEDAAGGPNSTLRHCAR